MKMIKCRIFVFAIMYFLLKETEETPANSKNDIVFKNCAKCPPGWGVVEKCTTDTDTHCIKCTQGKTYSSHRSSKSPCWSCSQCGVGLYEAHRCSPVRDTICDECISYLDHKNIIRNRDFRQKCTYLFL